MIAATIALVALDNLRSPTLQPWRIAAVFAFGLLHGLGFASALKRLGLPQGDEALALISFNLGVEAGQVAVLAMAFLAVGWARDKPWFASAWSSGLARYRRHSRLVADRADRVQRLTASLTASAARSRPPTLDS